MVNFLQETVQAIKQSNKSIKDIVFIGSLLKNESCSWGDFATKANFDYDNGYGGHIIRLDLVIVFDDKSQLVRQEYDGSEWWGYIAIPAIPEQTTKLESLLDKD